MKTITINQLETVFGRVIDKLKFELGKDGEFKSNTSLYREIPADKWTILDGDSTDEITGDLQDDIDDLIKLANDRSRICTYVDFDRISSLLKEISQIQNPAWMGLDTKIYCNHSLKIPNNTTEIVELISNIWNGKTKIVESIEVEENEKVKNLESYSILIYPKFIEFEKERFNQITLGTDFMFSATIKLYPNTIQLMPIGIGRNATNMIAQFMDEPFSIYADNPKEFKERKKSWKLFKSFLRDITKSIDGGKHLYINDGIFQGVEDLAWDGKTVEEMISAITKIVKPCISKSDFIENHTSKSDKGLTYIKGDIWFCEELNR